MSRAEKALIAFAFLTAATSAGLIGWKLWLKPRPPAPSAPPVSTPVKRATPVRPEADIDSHHISSIIDRPGDPLVIQRAAVEPPRDVKFALPVLLAANAAKSEAAGYFLTAPLISPSGGYMAKYSSTGGEANAAAAQLAYNEAVMNSDPGAAEAPSDEDGADDTPANAAAQYLTPANSNQVELTLVGKPSHQETLLKATIAGRISDLLISSGFSADSARAAEAAAKRILNMQSLPPGAAAIARGILDDAGEYRVNQFAVWEDQEYVGAIGLYETGQYGEAARPNPPDGLLDDAPPAAIPAQYDLADGVYSAGLRNGAPEAVVREAVELLSSVADLKAPLSIGEKIELLYTRDVRTTGSARARIVYAAVEGAPSPIACYAYETAEGAYLCYDPRGSAAGKSGSSEGYSGPGGGGMTAPGGLLAPIRGAPITSLFGMRFHPILHIFRLHGGIDFGAEIGSPVRAAADGKVEIAAEVNGFGNHIRVKHDGFETSYSHLSEFLVHPGDVVKQGDVIAKSGTTGLSTGPHLHFQYYLNGEAVDPFPHLSPELQSTAGALIREKAQHAAGGANIPLPPLPPTFSSAGHPTNAEKAAFASFKTAVDAVVANATK